MVEIISEKPEGNFSSTSYIGIKLSEFTDTLIKNLLFRIFKKELTLELLKVDKMLSISDLSKPVPSHVTANYNESNNYFQFPDSLILVSVIYKDEAYEMSFSTTIRRDYEVEFTMHIVGISGRASESVDLGNYIFNSSICNSNFKNKTISYTLQSEDDRFFLCESTFNVLSPKMINLNELFIPENKKDHIKRFIYAVENYKTDKINLRYLMSGIPGTGKTQLINSLISSLQGKATIVVCEGGNIALKSIIEFCSLFEVCILVIDDVDFTIGDRSDARYRKSLGIFLQFLDGFIPSNLFVLASTNDKKLVDEAASRPGRFDLILDIGEIDRENYTALVQRETNDLEIISLFTKDFLETLRVKHITGAYLVNFVKQLRSIKQMKGEISKVDFENCFNITHNGFYKSNADEYPIALGFN